MRRWAIFDHQLDKIVDFWWGDEYPREWDIKYPHWDSDGYERYSIECENFPSNPSLSTTE